MRDQLNSGAGWTMSRYDLGDQAEKENKAKSNTGYQQENNLASAFQREVKMRCYKTLHSRRKEALTMDRPFLGNWNDDYVLSTEINFSEMKSHSLSSSADTRPSVSIFDNFHDVHSFPAQTMRSDSSVLKAGASTSSLISPSSSCQTSPSTSWPLNSRDTYYPFYSRQISSTVSPTVQPVSPEGQHCPYFKPSSTPATSSDMATTIQPTEIHLTGIPGTSAPTQTSSVFTTFPNIIDVETSKTKDSQPTDIHLLPGAILSTNRASTSTPLSPTQTSSVFTTFPSIIDVETTKDSQPTDIHLLPCAIPTNCGSTSTPLSPAQTSSMFASPLNLYSNQSTPNHSSQTVPTPGPTQDSLHSDFWNMYPYLLAPTTQQPKQTESVVSLEMTDALDNSNKAEYSTKTKEDPACSEDIVFVTEVQKPELDKSTDIMFVRENYNRSGVVCLTPNRKSQRRKTPYTKRVPLDSATTEFKVTISQRNNSSNAVAPTSVWNYLMASGLQTFDPKTTSLLEHLYHSGADSNSSITVTLPGTADTYEINMQTMQMKNTLDGKEIVLFRRPIVINDSEVSTSGLSEFPSHWSPQENDIQVVPIYRAFNSSEWNTIESAMRRTLPNLRIRTIERVQNKKLWIRYAFQKAMLMDKNGVGTDVNEKLLFHGTRDNPPYKIWQSEDGFDMRYCKRGAWGLGTYFALEASYSDSYAHRPAPRSPVRQMVVASVLTGYSKDTLSNATLRRPPVRIPATAKDPEVLYDSVTGISGSSRIYILYKFDMAYPSYLVSYSA